jgi:hypothetical protein
METGISGAMLPWMDVAWLTSENTLAALSSIASATEDMTGGES